MVDEQLSASDDDSNIVSEQHFYQPSQLFNQQEEFNLSIVFDCQSDLPQIVSSTNIYNDFLTQLKSRYPETSKVKEPLKDIVEHLNNNYQNQHLFVISLLNQEQINDYIAEFNIEQIMQSQEHNVKQMMNKLNLANGINIYYDKLIKKIGKQYKTTIQLQHQMQPLLQNKKISKNRRISYYSEFQISQIIVLRDQLFYNQLQQTQTSIPTQISKQLNINLSTVYQVIRKQRLGESLRSQKLRKDDIQQFSTECKDDFVNFASLIKNQTISLKQRQKMFNQKYQINAPYAAYRNLMAQYKFSYRQTSSQNFRSIQPISEKKRVYMSLLMTELFNWDNVDILSVDESPFSMNIVPNKGWAPKGSGMIKAYTKDKGNNLTYLAIISMKYGVIADQLVDQNMKSFIFMNFIIKSIEIYKQKFQGEKIFIILDNAKIHLKKEFVVDLVKFNVNFIYNAPYSPKFNPIEELFGSIKGRMKYQSFNNRNELKKLILVNAREITLTQIRKFYLHSLVQYYMCIGRTQNQI